MAEFNRDVWAPWRMEYIEALGGPDDGCFLCRSFAAPADDEANRVVHRSDSILVLMNRFPYNSGHLLIAPAAHVGRMDEISADVLAELMSALRDGTRLIEHAIQAQGFNVGMNIGHCAGAGLPDHLHWHIVPRWSGDTNFMPVLGDVKVIPEALDRTYAKLVAAKQHVGLA